ncbi:uncharacterized protein EV154DRAFT_532500 [Mucor mucedo]|uniref:uncharacterized protein n=1 Tax=Mucor mucedo TaxID=29922 RepID=UPI0022204541|nr:uncharacterized protein EV154DRAFT_532500 [Mucor mucedo]KAI7866684.1 hypothetical protein EV154DRAFT_532500 [Mucor mucedo]
MHTSNDSNAGFFPLRSTRYPPGIPIHSIRSKRLYSNLADQQDFLKHLKAQWVQKLEDLKEDEKYLKRMKRIKVNETLGVAPLFTRKEDQHIQTDEVQIPELPTPTEELLAVEPLVTDTAVEPEVADDAVKSPVYATAYPTLQQRSDTTQQNNTTRQNNTTLSDAQDTLTNDGDDTDDCHHSTQSVEKEPGPIHTFSELESIFKRRFADELEEEERGHDEEEEDDEEARAALNLMLQEFGDDL